MYFGFLGLKVDKKSCLLWQVFLKVEVYRLPESEASWRMCENAVSQASLEKKKITSLRIIPRNLHMSHATNVTVTCTSLRALHVRTHLPPFLKHLVLILECV